MNLAIIFPLIVPSSYYKKGTWDLPHQQLSHKGFLLTWVTFNESNSMSYLTMEDYKELERNYPGWQQIAFDNLRRSIGDGETIFTHQAPRQNKKGIKFIAFIHSDGIGSSRILLNYELSNAFPEGYHIALPDRSCGLAIPVTLSSDELKEVKQLVKKMYKDATTPMSGELYMPEDFLLPNDWIKPVNEEYSQTLINEINKL